MERNCRPEANLSEAMKPTSGTRATEPRSGELDGKSVLLVLVYNHVPDRESLTRALGQVDHIILIDNHSNPDVVGQLRRFRDAHTEQCILVENDENKGISRAYNDAIRCLVGREVCWLHFLDHDAIFDEKLFVETRALWISLSQRGIPVGIVAPIVTDDPRVRDSHLWLKDDYSSLRMAITSGMLISREVFAALGGFDEQMFSDTMDFELSMRAWSRGLTVVRLNHVLIVQEFEEKPRAGAPLLSFLDRLVRLRSEMRIAIGNGNIHRTTLSVYTEPRQRDLVRSFEYVGNKLHSTRLDLLVIRVFVLAERTVTGVLQKIGGSSESTPNGE